MMLVTNFLTVGYAKTNLQEYPQKYEFFSGRLRLPITTPAIR